MKFSELKISENMKNVLYSNGFEELTNVQRESIPILFKSKDLIVHSQTGSGKTIVYMIPIIREVLLNKATSIVIVPTRELCYQIKEFIDLFQIECNIFIGGTAVVFPDEPSRLFIGTPGRILEFIKTKPEFVKKIKYFVLDEADKLLSFGFESTLNQIITKMPSDRTSVLCSATITDNLLKLSKKSLVNPKIIKIDEEIPENLVLQYAIVSPSQKVQALFTLIKNKKAIVFFSTCHQVDFMSEVMMNNDICACKIHGKMEQSERLKVYDEFEKKGGVLLCTDVAARGIDFKNIDLVIHFDIPKEYTNIVHRSGRTARNKQKGEALLLLMENEAKFINFLNIKKIEIELVELILDEGKLIEYGEIGDNINVKSFVSYIRSYKEHILNSILNYKDLDYDGLVKLFALTKIPNMKELRAVKFDGFVQPKTKKFKLRK